LKRSETLYRSLFESSADAIMMLDSTAFFDCNSSTLRMFGYPSLKDFQHKHPAELSPPLQPCGTDSMTLANEHIATAFRNGSHQFEWMYKRMDGSEFPSDVLLTAMDLDGKLILLATVRDITERKQVEEKARRVTALHETLEGLNQAESVKDICEAAIQGVMKVMDCDRASISPFGEDSRAHFAAWYGLSEDYRKIVESHCPWWRHGTDTEPICLPDIEKADLPEDLRSTTLDNGIRAVACFPLVGNGCLLGQYTAYFTQPRELVNGEITFGKILADHLVTAINRLRSVEELNLSEQRLRRIIEANPVPTIITSMSDGLVKYSNQPVAELFRVTCEEIVGKQTPDYFIHPEERNSIMKELAEAGKVQSCEVHLRRPDGTAFWALVTLSAIMFDEEPSVMAIIYDISDRKQRDLFIRQTANILEMVATGKQASKIYDAIALMYEGRHPGMRCSMLMLRGDKLIHGGAPSLPPEYCSAVNGLQNGPNIGSCGTSTFTGKRVLVEDIATDPKWTSLKEIALPHGLRSCWSEPIKDSGGTALGAFGMYYDHPALPNREELSDLESAARLAGIVMERERQETALRQSEQQFYQAQKMDALGTLVGGIAHNFNNTLAGMTGNLYLARKMVQENPAALEKLASVERLSFRAADMIQQLLTFARKGMVNMKEMPFTPFVRDVLQFLRSTVPENIMMQEDLCTYDLPIMGDATQIHQALMNLINNACDAVAWVDGPCVTFRLEAFHADDAFIDMHPYFSAEHYAHLSVEDNGCGIPEDQIEHIFEPFFTTKEVGKGTGLGLSMVYGALKTHHGFTEVESIWGRGTTFHLYIPLLEFKGIVAKPPLAEAEGIEQGQGETILLADDEEQVREIMAKVVESFGYRVIQVRNGLQAMEAFKVRQSEQGGEIALAMLDVVMPHLGGIPLAERLREINPAIPVIFMTGYDSAQVFGGREQLENSTILTKPVQFDALCQSIRKLLD